MAHSKARQDSRFLVYLAVLFVVLLYAALIACALAALAVAGGVIYGIIVLSHELHRFSPRLIVLGVMVAIGAILGCLAVLKGVMTTFARTRHFEPGVLVNMAKERQLSHLIAPLCSQMKTRIPDSVILHSDPTFFVTQARLQAFNGVARGRTLALGVPVLGAFTKNELRAILAHEFAHFTGQDTTYSTVVVPVFMGAVSAYGDLREMMAESESFWQNVPLFLPAAVLRVNLEVFSRIDSRISRARELRADAVAASVCGGRCFRSGLMKMAGVARTFGDDSAMPVVESALQSTGNYLTAFRTALPQLNALANSHFQRELAEPERTYDSHPSLKRRLDAVADTPDKHSDTESAVSLLPGLLEHEAYLSECRAKMAALARAVH